MNGGSGRMLLLGADIGDLISRETATFWYYRTPGPLFDDVEGIL